MLIFKWDSHLNNLKTCAENKYMNNYKTKHIFSSAKKDVERMLHVYKKH